MKYESTVTINRSVDDIFQFVANVSTLPHYTKVVDARVRGAGHLARGAQLDEVFGVGPWRWRLTSVVEEFEPNRLIRYRSVSSRVVRWHGTLSLQPTDEGRTTRVRAAGEVRLRGPLRLLEPLMASELQLNEAQEMENLKDLLEGHPRH